MDGRDEVDVRGVDDQGTGGRREGDPSRLSLVACREG